MPTISLNKKVFEELVGKKLSLDKLKERISMLGTDLEKIDDNEIHVEIFPNRPDMLSEQGFARAFSSFIGEKTGLRKYKIYDSTYKMKIEQSVKEVRPYTACCVVKNLVMDDEKIKEIIQIQEKLHITYGRNRKKVAIGIYPLDKIKMPIKFVGVKPKDIKFVPLESNREMNGNEILENHPAGKEYGHLLEGKKVFPLFVDANNNVLSIPPIINSELVGRVDEKTKDVFIECSGFDYETLSKCLNMIVTALADMGGKIYSMEIDMYGKKVISPNLNPSEMKIDLNYINNWLGLELKEKDLKILLEKMGFGYENKKALIPSYRSDILHQVDLAEDIAIAYGYENINEEIPKVATIGQESEDAVKERKISEILSGLGFLECKTYHIVNRESQTNMMDVKKDMIELANALNADFDVMAAWIMPSLFEVLKGNRQREYPQNIFTIGGVFSKGNTDTGIEEKQNLSCLMCGEDVDFTKIKQVLDYVFRMIGRECKIKETKHNSFIEGRVGSVVVNGKDIGIIGEISPQVLENWELKFPVVGFEISL